MRTLPKAPERLSCEIGMLAFWLPNFWTILENAPEIIHKNIEQLSEIGPYPTKWAEKLCTGAKFGCRPVPRAPGP